MSHFSVNGTVSSEPKLARTATGVPLCGFHLVEDEADAPASNPLRLDVISKGGLATMCAQLLGATRRVAVEGHLGRREVRRRSFAYPEFSVVATSVRPLAEEPVASPLARVVHCQQDPYDVYIGRGRCPHTNSPGEWGNPFSHRPSKVPGVILVGSAHEAVERYERWLWGQIKAARVDLAALCALDGKTLGCWCMDICHGTVLARAAAWAKRRVEAGA